MDSCNLSDILDNHKLDLPTKFAAAKSSPFVVTVVSRNLPASMAFIDYPRRGRHFSEDPREHVYWQSGTIIECEQDVVDRKYSSIIIVAATIFVRDNDVQPHQIKVDVYLSDGKLCDGHVVACDHHYNLAAVKMHTDFPLRTAPLRELDDVVPIFDSNDTSQLAARRSFQLVAHSNLFKVSPGTKLVSLGSDFQSRDDDLLHVYPGVFCTNVYPNKFNCNELYWVEDCNREGDDGGPVINLSGEVVGIMFYDSPFLPINIVIRWWKNFQSYGNYCRPWSGVDVANLYSSHLDFLEEIMKKFPNISGGVVVTKVAEESPAYCSRLQAKDVIVEADGKSIRSKLEFFEILWDKVGKSVELNVLRPSNGDELKLILTVGEADQKAFYHWPQNMWTILGGET